MYGKFIGNSSMMGIGQSAQILISKQIDTVIFGSYILDQNSVKQGTLNRFDIFFTLGDPTYSTYTTATNYSFVNQTVDDQVYFGKYLSLNKNSLYVSSESSLATIPYVQVFPFCSPD